MKNLLMLISLVLFVGCKPPVSSSEKEQVQEIPNPIQLFSFDPIKDFNQIVATKKDKVRVMIIDTGVQFTHPNLKPFFKNANKNGEVRLDHGTKVAGVIALALIEAFGPKISDRVEFISCNYTELKYYDGYNNLRNEIDCLEQAHKENIDIVNFSGSGLEYSQDEYNMLLLLQKKGVILVTAAGNEGKTSVNSYPCSFKLSNVVCVGSLTLKNHRLGNSNLSENVKFMARGEKVNTIGFDNKPSFFAHTSAATPQVTALYIAKMLSADDDTLAQVSFRGRIHTVKVVDQIETNRQVASQK